VEDAKRAGLLAKTDLVSEMVLEFASLQGLMGMHYANNDGEAEAVATAIYEQYLPKGAGGELPASLTGAALSLADRIDTLIGIFGIGQLPTGNKDPFALRRQALAIINIIVDKSLDLDLKVLFDKALSLYNVKLDEQTVEKALSYTLERFKAYYQAQGLITEIYLSVAAKAITKPLDFDSRVKAVAGFNELDEASDLAAANKRVANILAKQEGEINRSIDPSLLQEDAEKALFSALEEKQQSISTAAKNNDYHSLLQSLASLRNSIDTFFDDVMVMADDEALKNNRIALLASLRELFLQVADISLLAKK
jgi:glycyl-tRNA synthetase beta chain